MTPDNIAIVLKHIGAVSAMLLGSRRLKPGAAIVGGEPLEFDGRVNLAEMAAMSNTDIVYLEFDDTPQGIRMTDIVIVMPRDNYRYVHTGCRLYLTKSGSTAVLLPQPHVRGKFRLASNEIVQVDHKPVDVEAGSERAEARVAKLVERGVNLSGQIELTQYAVAA